MNELDKKVKFRIYSCRLDSGLTQEELAEKLNTTRNQISYFENGKRKPTIEQIVEMSKIFNVSTDYLLCLSSVATKDTNIQAICEYTGLYESSINKFYHENKLKIKQYTTNSLSDEEYQKEKKDQFNNIILDLLFDFDALLTNYKNDTNVEKNTILNIDSSIKKTMDNLKISKYDYEWFIDHTCDFYDIQESVENLTKNRKCSLLDLQELFLNYAKEQANTAEIQHIEKEHACLMNTYKELFDQAYSESKNE